MKRAFLFLLIACLLMSTLPAHAENWVKIHTDDWYDLYIDQDRITRNGSIVEVWMGEDDEMGEMDYNTLIDCQSRQFREVQSWDPYDKKMTPFPNTTWHSPKNAGDHAMFDHVCGGG